MTYICQEISSKRIDSEGISRFDVEPPCVVVSSQNVQVKGFQLACKKTFESYLSFYHHIRLSCVHSMKIGEVSLRLGSGKRKIAGHSESTAPVTVGQVQPKSRTLSPSSSVRFQ
jgi:hypothetical protein